MQEPVFRKKAEARALWHCVPLPVSYTHLDVYKRQAIIEGEGVYIEELKKAIEERGLDIPPFYGLALDDESADMEQIVSDFRAFVKSIA